jgi:hypothetical protein
MQFIRMPLGPVPVGFKQLSAPDIFVQEVPTSALSYDKQVYHLTGPQVFFDTTQLEINQALETLLKLSTNQLVDFSHREPSWIKHANGEEYFIDEADLIISLPITNNVPDAGLDDQKLQAKLVEGMLEDIVVDSTALEYPDFTGK